MGRAPIVFIRLILQHFGDDWQRTYRVTQRDGVEDLQDDGETEFTALRHVISQRLRLSIGVRVVTDVRIRLTARYRHLSGHENSLNQASLTSKILRGISVEWVLSTATSRGDTSPPRRPVSRI